MTVVLDASVALGWLLPDEPRLELRLSSDSILHVPPVFSYEVAHAILKAVRRDRLTKAQADDLLQILDGFPIRISPLPRTLREIWHDVVGYEVNAYDSAYLSLATELDLSLATLDERLADAARKAGVTVIGSSL